MQISYTGNTPVRGSAQAAGNDLITPIEITIKAGEKVLIDTGTAMEIPTGYFGMGVPRSSLCNKNGLHLVNSVGIMDSDYRGNIMFCYENRSDTDCVLLANERIGQVVILPYVAPKFIKVSQLDDTERGSGGFGHSGRV